MAPPHRHHNHNHESPQRHRSRRSPSRSRSRSPAPESDHQRRRRRYRSPSRSPSDSRSRSRSASPIPHRHHRHHQSSSHRRDHRRDSPHHPRQDPAITPQLPFDAISLDRKRDFVTYRPLFGLYLDIQKGLVMEELEEREVKGRWKGWVGRWNRGELAEGWYEPETLRKAQASASATASASRPSAKIRTGDDRSAYLSDDDVGPALPRGRSEMAEAASQAQAGSERHGPAIPNLQDLELRRETVHDESQAERSDLHHQRLLDRRDQKAQLDDLLPRAEAGTKDRQLEKKREKADSHRAFASAKVDAVGGIADVPDADLLGGGGDDGGGEGGIEGFRKQQREMERKKNEREIRREEIMRARQMEREARLRDYKAREERTMSGLIRIAKARFG